MVWCAKKEREEAKMSRTYEFLKECETFFVATINKNVPAIRPFGAIMEIKQGLYFSTANIKDVYSQLKSNQAIQIVALKSGTRDWVRITGKAIEVNDLDIKQKMLETCPILLKRFDSNDCEYFAVFKLTDMESALNSNGEIINLT